MESSECFHNKYNGDQCQKPAVWKGKGVGNMTDEWTWCEEHCPGVEWREPIDDEK